jgi:peptidoglycan/xylan/chitin deacetylase (PgdA/CDA1 family)
VLLVLAVIIAAAAVLSHTAPRPMLFEAFRPGDSVWRMPADAGGGRRVYLTFDDGPNLTWTPAVLDALRDEGATATFFLIDDHVTDESAPIVRRIAGEGHAIALHSGTRRPMLLTPDAFAMEIARASARLAAITGAAPCRLFRPHAGWRSAAMYDGLRRSGYKLAGWSWGMWDWDWWRTPQAGRVAPRLAKKARPGDIIVIHDGHHADPDADRRHAGATVRLLAPALRQKGLSFGRLCEMTPSGA